MDLAFTSYFTKTNRNENQVGHRDKSFSILFLSIVNTPVDDTARPH